MSLFNPIAITEKAQYTRVRIQRRRDMKKAFSLEIKPLSPQLSSAIVKVPVHLVQKFYRHAAQCHQQHVNPYGFSQGSAPLSYIEQNFSNHILSHLKEFFLRSFVISFLYRELREAKIVIAGEPRLTKSIASSQQNAEFHFEFNPIHQTFVREWKYITFKAPRRKQYKDIDKQATEFMQEEETNEVNHKTKNTVSIGDWVNFNIFIVDDKFKPVLDDFKENMWLRIGAEETSVPFQELFLHRKKGEKFCADSLCLQEFFNTNIETRYNFLIEILDIVHQAFFSLDSFKKHFRLKTNKKAHQKLVEVFSFKNDLCLRRAIIEDAFELLLSTYELGAPSSAVLRRQQIILESLQENPDYAVYKTQTDFYDKVRELAHKQVNESVFMELLAYYEDLTVADDDVRDYLNLTQRARTKDFIHFQHPAIIANKEEYPIQSEPLKQICLREKALNYSLFHLTKN